MKTKNYTLREWYELIFCSLYHSDAALRTIVEYKTLLNLWERLGFSLPLKKITSIDMAEFRTKLSVGRSPSTVNKHLRHLNHLLTKAGTAGPRNRDALGVIKQTPWAKPLRVYKKTPVTVSFESIDLMFNACSCMKNTDYWRAFLVFAFNTGSRFEAITHVCDSDIDWANRTVSFRAEHDKRRIERKKPLSLLTVSFLHKLRGKGLLCWKRPKKAFYRAWHRIQRFACLTTEQVFTPHGLKRACGSCLSQFASTWAVKYMLDHSQTDVTGNHYIDPTTELRAVVEKLPQPNSFLKGMIADVWKNDAVQPSVEKIY